MDEFPKWLATEEAVKEFFLVLGFSVESLSISGRQIDIMATRHDDITGETQHYIIEVTTEKVGLEKGSKDSQKLLMAKQEYENARLMIVSLKGFTDDQAATLRKLGITPKRLYELEETRLPLRQYALAAKQDLSNTSAPDIGYHPTSYIDPELSIEAESGTHRNASLTEWINSVLVDPQPGLCAVLGSLGSGKTSLLKHLLERGIERFLDNPDEVSLPFYISLGRYKQHAGDLDQMIMAELSRSGIKNYPASMVRFLLDKRRIIILLDGLDEVHPIQNTDDILETVTNIVSGIGRNASGIISCRRQFFQSSVEEQAYFGSFTAGKLRDLNSSLQKALRGYSSTYRLDVLPFDITRIEKYLSLRCGLSKEETSKLLDQYYGFPEMATTPVLLAMIATTVAEGALNVDVKSVFPHVELYEAYTIRWIERDVGRARLTASQRALFSEHLADNMLWSARDSAPWGDLADALRANLEWGNNPLPPEEAELDIRNSGFLIRDFDDRWRFVHRSILEYFAAKAEVRRLIAGEKPRHVPTDGYSLFLSELIAQHWLNTGTAVFPVHSWQSSRGNEILANQWSILAAASMRLPESLTATVFGINNVNVTFNSTWKNTTFQKLHASFVSEMVEFKNCSFLESELHFQSDKDQFLNFIDCKFGNTKLYFSVFPNWQSVYDANQPRTVDVPAAIWRLSTFVDQGATVFVKNQQWVLRGYQLDIFLECAKKLQGKTYHHNFIRGAFATELESILPALIQRGLVSEDKSRQGHQLIWTSHGRELAKMLQTDPMRAQLNVAELF